MRPAPACVATRPNRRALEARPYRQDAEKGRVAPQSEARKEKGVLETRPIGAAIGASKKRGESRRSRAAAAPPFSISGGPDLLWALFYFSDVRLNCTTRAFGRPLVDLGP